jgi:hypothetical protein
MCPTFALRGHMSLDPETTRWAIGGFISGLSVIAVVAYNDAEFYINWLVSKLMGVVVILYFCTSFFWLGMKVIKDFSEDKLSLTPDKLKLLKSTYENITDYTSIIIVAIIISFFWTLLMVSLAGARMRNKKV